MSVYNSVVGSNNVVRGNNYGNMTMSFSNISNHSSFLVNGKEFTSMKNMKVTIEYTNDECTNEESFIQPNNGGIRVDVKGDVGKIEMQNGDLTVDGNVAGYASTTNANIRVGGSVGGNAVTKNGNISVSGDLGNDATTSNGNVVVNGKRLKRKR